jgi:hypothetical protein
MSEADDREFAVRAMARLRGDAPPAGMTRRLLDAYEAARPRGGKLARLAELLWPGMPLWAPGAAFAAALLLGIGVGVALPGPMAGRTAFSLEEPPSVSVESLLVEER